MADPATIRAVLDAYRDDPAGFNRAILGRELWSKQVEVCESIARSPITVVPAGRAVGKSYLLAGVVLWWLYTRPMSLVITTGPDHRQVVSVLWKEIRKAIRSARAPLGYDHLTQGYGSPQRLQLRSGTEWQALGFACKSEEGLSGQHAADLLVIVDEASGVEDRIWSAIHGLAAARLVVVGNPIKYDCHFRELHDLSAASATIRSVPISSLECPDAGKETSPVGMACLSFLRQMREIHGEDSPWWRSNVLGLFPGQESVRFLPTAWLDACTRPEVLDDELWKDYPPGPTRMAVDVGGGVGADRSAVVVRDDRRLLEVFASEWHGVLDDARFRIEPVVLDLAEKWRVTPDHVIFDKGGLGRSFGSYLAKAQQDRIDRWLRDHPDHFGPEGAVPRPFEGAVGYFGAGKGGKLYVNRRTSVAFALRRRLDPHRKGHVPFSCGGIPEWPALRQELAELRSPTMEMEEGCVRQVLEPKEALMARLHRSPDLLDAFLMSFTFSE
jgi:phage terminase large subunit